MACLVVQFRLQSEFFSFCTNGLYDAEERIGEVRSVYMSLSIGLASISPFVHLLVGCMIRTTDR